jgi:hypothetical protein
VRAVLAAGLLIGLVQTVRVAPTNAPGHADLGAPVEVQAILRPACYDCHSNETEWPWYSRIAPAAWIVQHDIDEGRRRLNFSEWAAYASDPDTAVEKLRKIGAAVTNREMAPWYYRALHPSARLTAAQRDVLIRWVEQETAHASVH